jgi:cobyrinic acid a,c-diamide synthase
MPSVLEPQRRARIAIADDACFGLCFQDNLDLLRNGGAELIGFSPMADRKLPADLGGLYLTGAYLDEYGRDLSSNQYMLEAIREFADAGGAIYAEGASAAYLCERFGVNSESLPGVGVLPAPAEAQPEEFEYCDAAGIADSVLGMAGFIMRGVNTGRWHAARQVPVLKSIQASRIRRRIVPEGYVPRPNIFVSFCLWHWGSCPETVDYFLEAARMA